MRIHEILYERVSQQEITWLDNLADKLFGEFGIDVEFTRHFFDRANDEREKLVDREGVQNITASELAKMFVAAYKTAKDPNSKYAKVTDIKPGMEANLADHFTNINIPFAMTKSGNQIVMSPKTVMRSKNFHTSGGQKKIPVNTKNVSV
jgi:hypothetical protein